MEFHTILSDYGIGKDMLTSTILDDTLNIDNPYFKQMEYVLGKIILRKPRLHQITVKNMSQNTRKIIKVKRLVLYLPSR